MSSKKNKFVDAHNHLSMTAYKHEDIIDMICEQAYANRLEFMIVNGGHAEENKEVIKLAKKYPDLIKPVIGIHPEDGIDENDYLRYKDLIDETIVGIGEIGLDYFYEEGVPSRENQIKSFRNQIKLAQELNLPIVVHIRDKIDQYQAYQDVYDILKEFPNIKVMLHTFAGNMDWAKKFLEFKNLYFSFSGAVTYGTTNQTRDIIEFLPLERILTETDAPFLRVHPYTEQKNEPNTVLFVAYYIAGIKKVGMDKFTDRINKNLRTLFNL
ncbi:TatD family hydrolase [Mycoplasma sp. 2045]|uniref:TatD family hydrolase n=1 Tax=Mycoplasma sp. 2045 TaxID=2967301 RepID=UPI00211BC483|nr:TatD family hydrolase [Mycoplasma sp. 2045]UUM20379.1 TatD family hydrolase [Mycoplasma sp. 2045]